MYQAGISLSSLAALRNETVQLNSTTCQELSELGDFGDVIEIDPFETLTRQDKFLHKQNDVAVSPRTNEKSGKRFPQNIYPLILELLTAKDEHGFSYEFPGIANNKKMRKRLARFLAGR